MTEAKIFYRLTVDHGLGADDGNGPSIGWRRIQEKSDARVYIRNADRQEGCV